MCRYGHPAAGRAGAELLPHPFWRASALVRLAEVVAAGDPDQAARVAAEAETTIARINDANLRAQVFARLVEALAVGGDSEKAETLAATIADPVNRTQVLIGLVKVLAAGDPDRALGVATAVTVLAERIIDVDKRVEMLASLAVAVATGDPAWATRIANERL